MIKSNTQPPDQLSAQHLHPPRPNRRFRPSQEIDVHTSYGDQVDIRDPSHIRIFFQNTKGLTYSATGEDYDYYLSSLANMIDSDISGLAETNTAWQHFHLQADFKKRTQKHFAMTKIAFSSPSSAIDPIPENESYHPGGTVTLAIKKMVPLSHGPSFGDPTGLGRWSGMHFRGKDNRIFTVITAYRVCSGSIQTAPLGSAFAREYEYIREHGEISPRPRKTFLSDLATFILSIQAVGNSVLVMMDSNGQLTDDADLQSFVSQCDMHDLHAHFPSPSTYIGASNRRIDHMLGCPQVVDSMVSSGSLSYLEGPQSDHRGLFVDQST